MVGRDSGQHVLCPPLLAPACAHSQPVHCILHPQDQYGFKAHEFHASGFASRDEYVQRHGSDLYMTDIEEYDRICKVG